jgi:hypothetical protein
MLDLHAVFLPVVKSTENHVSFRWVGVALIENGFISGETWIDATL